jgi:hypothetical protein
MSLQPENPPELSYADYHRNVRNSCRQDAIDAIGKLEVNLQELMEEGSFIPMGRSVLAKLADLQDYLKRDMEE